ncbi:MAG: hypothetical protein AB1486_21105 [Planctomycetota bacterium]
MAGVRPRLPGGFLALILFSPLARPGQIEDLIARLASPVVAEQDAAMRELAALGPCAIPHLEAPLAGNDKGLSYRAEMILVSIREGTSFEDLAKIAELVGRLGHLTEQQVNEIGAGRDPPLLTEVVQKGAAAVPALVRNLRQPGLIVPEFGDARAFKELPVATVIGGFVSAEALARIGKPAMASLVRLLCDEEGPASFAVILLASMGPDVQEPLRRMLASDPTPEQCRRSLGRRALWTLALSGDAEVVPEILRLAECGRAAKSRPLSIGDRCSISESSSP